MMRIGLGYDVHGLVAGRPLNLGGVRIPHGLGLEGHSDADVLLHAIMDALLGAAALGDLGVHFPDTDARWRGADSRMLLGKVRDLVEDAGYQVANIDAMVALEIPKLRPHIEAMRRAVATTMQVDINRISIKATTTEHLGFVGRKEGIAAWAACLLQEAK